MRRAAAGTFSTENWRAARGRRRLLYGFARLPRAFYRRIFLCQQDLTLIF
jgi:hypothetical protein